MTETLLEFVLDESKWPALAIGVGLLVPGLRWRARRRDGLSLRACVQWAMNTYFALLVGTLAFGHLLAVSIRHAQGTLDAELPVALLYGLGVLLLVPSVVLARATNARAADPGFAATSTRLNAWLGITLVALDPISWPLALPAVFNIAHQHHSRRAWGWTVVGLAASSTAVLFVGSLVFLISGQTFEESRGM